MGSVARNDRKGIGNGECPVYENGLQEITTLTHNACTYIYLGNVRIQHQSHQI